MPYIGQPPVTGDTTKSFRLLDNLASFTLTFDATSSSVVDTSANTLTFANHRFVTAQRVTYTDGGGTAIGGLTDGTAYFVIKVDQNTIQLASSASNANNSTAISLSSGAAGGSHTLNLAFDGTNTKFKATYGNGTKAKISRAGQLLISINGVLQQAQESSSPTLGFGLDSDSTIVFSQAPVSTDVLFGQILADTITNFDTQDNTLDVFTGDGSTTAFTLSKKPASNNDILVTLDGVVQYPTTTSTSNAYSVTDNTLSFTSAPADGVAIQVRHIGFAGATSSAVTGFYGRTGNVTLSSSDDDITVGNVTAGIITATSYGSISGTTASFSGNVSIGGTLTYEDVTNIDAVGLITARKGIKVDDLGVQVGTGATVDSAGNNILTFLTNGSERARIDASGKLQIGTTSGASQLHVQQSSVSSAPSRTAALYLENDGNCEIQFVGNSSNDCQLRFGTSSNSFKGALEYQLDNDALLSYVNGSERMRIDSSGRLLLGTTTEGKSGADEFTVATSSNTGITIRSGTSSTGDIMFSDGTSGDDEFRGIVRYDHSNNSMQLWSNASERMRIDSSGRIGMGNDSPGSYSAVADDLVVGNHSGAHGITIAAENNNTAYLRFADGTANSGQQANGQIAYSHADLSMRFNVDASERMRIDSSGRVGINETALSSFNSIADDLVISQASGSAGITVRSSTTGSGTLAFTDGANTNFRGDIRYVHNGDYMRFTTAGEERMRIDSSGNMGLGTNNPTADGLHIVNSTQPDLFMGTSANAEGFKIVYNNTDSVIGNVTSTPLRFVVGNSESGRFDSSGRLLLGTTTEGEASADNLTIADSGNCGLTIRSGTNNFGSIYFSDATSGAGEYDGYIAYNQPSRYMQFAIGQAERMRVDSSGRLLVGTTTVNSSTALGEFYKASGDINLNVQTDSLASGQAAYLNVNATKSGGSTSYNASLGIYKHSGINEVSAYLNLSNTNNRFMWNDTSGNFRTSTSAAHIGTTSGTVVGTQTSDERLKNIGADVAYGLAEVKQLQPKQYTLKTKPDTNKLGFIAQQVESIIPEAVFDTDEELDGHEDGDRTKLGMEYVQLIPVLVNAIKELSAEVDTLKTKVAALEG